MLKLISISSLVLIFKKIQMYLLEYMKEVMNYEGIIIFLKENIGFN